MGQGGSAKSGVCRASHPGGRLDDWARPGARATGARPLSLTLGGAGPLPTEFQEDGAPGSRWGKVSKCVGRQQRAWALESDLVGIPGLPLAVCSVASGNHLPSLSLRP